VATLHPYHHQQVILAVLSLFLSLPKPGQLTFGVNGTPSVVCLGISAAGQAGGKAVHGVAPAEAGVHPAGQHSTAQQGRAERVTAQQTKHSTSQKSTSRHSMSSKAKHNAAILLL
jgi:hypothetical protein